MIFDSQSVLSQIRSQSRFWYLINPVTIDSTIKIVLSFICQIPSHLIILSLISDSGSHLTWLSTKTAYYTYKVPLREVQMGVAQERNEKHPTCAITWTQRTVWSTWIQCNIPVVYIFTLLEAPTTNKVNWLEFRVFTRTTVSMWVWWRWRAAGSPRSYLVWYIWCVVPGMSLWWRSRWKGPAPHKTEDSRPKQHMYMNALDQEQQVWKHAGNTWYLVPFFIFCTCMWYLVHNT